MKKENIRCYWFRIYWLLLVICWLMSGVSRAVVRPPPVSPDDGIPAAPEPYQLAMLTGGLIMVGGYIGWRFSSRKKKQ